MTKFEKEEMQTLTSTHVRIAECSAYYALPEAVRGIYVGGGASVRVARIIGKDWMIEMMLTGRTHDAVAGHDFGISHYLVDDGAGESLGLNSRAGSRPTRRCRTTPS
jgi:(methylthio)acryloyl-CoA hydratase